MKSAFPIQKAIVAIVLVVVMTGCLETSVKEGDTNVGVIPTSPEDPFYPGAFICNAFDNGAAVEDTAQGLLAELFYLRDDQPRYATVDEYVNLGEPVRDVSLYFNSLDVPTRAFDTGFTTSEGEVILNQNGTTLYEYLGLRVQADIKLGEGEEEGDYQFALLSDDGSTLEIDGQQIVNNDGDHPTRFACATMPVRMRHDDKKFSIFKYYQGPRRHIAAQVMWRKWPSNVADVNDPQCGQYGNDMYFDWRTVPSTPRTPYLDLRARGWKPLAPGNYRVPQGVINMCNFPPPNVTEIRAAAVGRTSITVTFKTHVPAIAKLLLTNVATGAVISTPFSGSYLRSHQVEAAGLAPATIYNLSILAQSPSLRETQTAPIRFKTAP